MNKIIAIGIVALFVAAAVPAADASRSAYVNYLPGAYANVEGVAERGLIISCSGDPHTWVPHDWTQDEILENPDGWAFSGEPECAPNDLMNQAQGTSQPGGFAGGAFDVFPAEALKLVIASTNDQAFGVGNSFMRLEAPVSLGTGEQEFSEGCGTQAVTIPVDPTPHWQADPSDPYYLVWALIPPVGITADLEACFSSTGVVEAIIG